MKNQKSVIKLTNHQNSQPILIGTKLIISIEPININDDKGKNLVSEIKSVGAMVSTFYVKESIEEIYNLIENK